VQFQRGVTTILTSRTAAKALRTTVKLPVPRVTVPAVKVLDKMVKVPVKAIRVPVQATRVPVQPIRALQILALTLGKTDGGVVVELILFYVFFLY